jgi:hypothetical protein
MIPELEFENSGQQDFDHQPGKADAENQGITCFALFMHWQDLISEK